MLVYRDALMLALADHDELSPEERTYLDGLAERMALSRATTDAIFRWTRDYDALLDRMTALLDGPQS